jgi:hypothetical protein
MIPGRSKAAFKAWLIQRPQAWREAVESSRWTGSPASTSNGPTEAINGRLEHLRGSASASATSPTTSPDPYSRQADSDPDYTLHW